MHAIENSLPQIVPADNFYKREIAPRATGAPNFFRELVEMLFNLGALIVKAVLIIPTRYAIKGISFIFKKPDVLEKAYQALPDLCDLKETADRTWRYGAGAFSSLILGTVLPEKNLQIHEKLGLYKKGETKQDLLPENQQLKAKVAQLEGEVKPKLDFSFQVKKIWTDCEQKWKAVKAAHDFSQIEDEDDFNKLEAAPLEAVEKFYTVLSNIDDELIKLAIKTEAYLENETDKVIFTNIQRELKALKEKNDGWRIFTLANKAFDKQDADLSFSRK